MNIINECVDNLIVHALDVELQKHTDIATNEELYKIMKKELEWELIEYVMRPSANLNWIPL